MFSPPKIKNIVSLIIILVINLIFVYKYSIEYQFPVLLILIIYLAGITTFITLLNKKFFKNVANFLRKNYITISSIFILLTLLFIIYVPRLGEVGRATAIFEWLNLCFDGVYPYTSYITPSAFPLFYFIVSPVYFFNIPGLLEVTGFIIFLFLFRYYSLSPKNLIVFLFFLFSSPIFYYEFLTRSELSFNLALVIAVITFANIKLKQNSFSIILFGLLFGTVLSTRSVMIIPIIIYSLFQFRNNLVKLLLFSGGIAATFLLQLIPFVIWDPELFFERGPFSIQSHLADLSVWVIFFFILLSIYSGWLVQNIREVFFSSGLIIFSMIILSYINKISVYGFDKAFFGNNYIDLAYLAFVVPLLILSIEDYELKNFVGRRLE